MVRFITQMIGDHYQFTYLRATDHPNEFLRVDSDTEPEYASIYTKEEFVTMFEDDVKRFRLGLIYD
jgi:hypothetical protein